MISGKLSSSLVVCMGPRAGVRQTTFSKAVHGCSGGCPSRDRKGVARVISMWALKPRHGRRARFALSSDTAAGLISLG